MYEWMMKNAYIGTNTLFKIAYQVPVGSFTGYLRELKN